MPLIVENTSFFVLNMKTRMPFRYGIATLEALPHVFLEAEVRIDGNLVKGISAEGLPPKWFTKDLAQSFEDELEEMIGVVRLAADWARRLDASPSPFELWRRLNSTVRNSMNKPALLVGLGISMVERAVIDACCRHLGCPFHQAVHENELGVELSAIHSELQGSQPADWLPAEPISTLKARHTVGLSDPLTHLDVLDGEEIRDGLPHTLEEVVHRYGIHCAKIKVSGELDRDIKRLDEVLAILESAHGSEFSFTLDGNEYFQDVEVFTHYCKELSSADFYRRHRDRLLFFEQPFHRSVALEVDLVENRLPDSIPIIIDESDATLDTLRIALERGYAGTSHKNCKGVFKSIAHACFLNMVSLKEKRAYIMSSEDLATVGPVALLQDLAVVGTLGITHSERNGHHYFRGLSEFPKDMQLQMLNHHEGLYNSHPEGFPILQVRNGNLNLNSIHNAPFGYGFDLEPAILDNLDSWSSRSLIDL